MKLDNTIYGTLTILEANNIYIDTLEQGTIVGPSAIVAENANHPGEFFVFDTGEECADFIKAANAEGDAFFRIQHHPEEWDAIWYDINQQKKVEAEEEFLHEELKAGEEEQYYFELECELNNIRIRR